MARHDPGNERIDTVRIDLIDRHSTSCRHGVSRLLRAAELRGVDYIDLHRTQGLLQPIRTLDAGLAESRIAGTVRQLFSVANHQDGCHRRVRF